MRFSLAVLVTVALVACGKDEEADPGNGDVNFDTHTLMCASDTLTLTTADGFGASTTVEFEMGDTSYDGSPVVLNDGSIACGLPPAAAPGVYHVFVDGEDAGTVTLQQANC